MAGETGAPLRAWVDYYRDLGVYDFYRRGEPVHPTIVEEVAVPATPAEINCRTASCREP